MGFGSKWRRSTSAASRFGGSSKGSRARPKVPQWTPRKRAARRSSHAWSASSGEIWTDRRVLAGCVRADGEHGQIEGTQGVSNILEVAVVPRVASEVEALGA